jgi:CRISPR/Cas system CMR-associated protein Cmr5 small subunit
MQNLDQIRAANALDAAARVNRKAVTKLPAMIVNNGLLAAAAFAKDRSEELRDAMNAVAEHLADRRIGHLPEASRTTDALLGHLVGPGVGSDRLRLATSEALAYLSYLKRFANRGD